MMYFFEICFVEGNHLKWAFFVKVKLFWFIYINLKAFFNLCNHCFLIEQTMTEWQNIQPLVQVIGRGRKKDLVIYVFYFRLWLNFKLRHGKKKGGRERNTITYHMDVILFVDSWLLGRCKCKFDDTAPLRIYLLYPHYPVNTTNSQQTQKLHLASLYVYPFSAER